LPLQTRTRPSRASSRRECRRAAVPLSTALRVKQHFGGC
jgi:hypothetical protein